MRDSKRKPTAFRTFKKRWHKSNSVNNGLISSLRKEYPFLSDRKTVKHIRSSKVFFIMRGLPGSGKSTVAKAIKAKYKDAVLCSADDYFIQEDGTYVHSFEKLADAHSMCKEKAQRAVDRGIRHVVVDNTNIYRWEMGKYFHMASQYKYVVLVIEPNTPWKQDPVTLAARNKHGCTKELLLKKQKKFESIHPFYWGWFLKKPASAKLISLSETYFDLCMRILPEFASYINKAGTAQGIDVPITFRNFYYIKDEISRHCTSFFSGYRKDRHPETEEYATKVEVQRALGKAFNLKLVGVMLTPRTVGIRVVLNKTQLALWGGVDVWSPQPDPKMDDCKKDELSQCVIAGNYKTKDISLTSPKKLVHSKNAIKKSGNDIEKLNCEPPSNSTCDKDETVDCDEVGFLKDFLDAQESDKKLLPSNCIDEVADCLLDPLEKTIYLFNSLQGPKKIDSNQSDTQLSHCHIITDQCLTTSDVLDIQQNHCISDLLHHRDLDVKERNLTDSDLAESKKCKNLGPFSSSPLRDANVLTVGSDLSEENNKEKYDLAVSKFSLPKDLENLSEVERTENLDVSKILLADTSSWESENHIGNNKVVGENEKSLTKPPGIPLEQVVGKNEESVIKPPGISLKQGSRAHITVGFVSGYSAVQTGFDQMELLLCEENGSVVGQPIVTDDVTIMYYGEGRCAVEFDWPIYTTALFTGNY